MKIHTTLLFVALFIHAADGLRFFVIGDWGTGESDQENVATAMAEYAAQNTVDFIISTGDNFYPDGVFSATDPQFEDKWRNKYNQASLANLVWYISVGNHDHRSPGGEWYQVEFGTNEPRWYYPHITFNFTKTAGSAKAVFVSIDSQTVIYNKEGNNPASIIDLMTRVLQDNADNSTWKFVFDHHPGYSCGTRDGSGEIREQIITVMDQYNADALLAGHEHNLQHLRKRGSALNVDHVTSGGGGRGLYSFNPVACASMDVDNDVESLFFSETHGFCVVDVNDNQMTVSYRNQNNEEIYTFTRTKTF